MPAKRYAGKHWPGNEPVLKIQKKDFKSVAFKF